MWKISFSLHKRTQKKSVAYPGIFLEGGSTNSVEDRGQRENGDLEAVAP
jgi:hypothetical protein